MNSGASGVVWAGPAYDRGGYGTVTRSYVRGLARIGFPVRLLPTGPRHAEIDPAVAEELRSLERARVGSSPALVVHSTPELFRIAPRLGFVRRIGCTIFETDGLPPRWAEMCNAMDEVWVPSRFNLETFSAAGVHPQKLAVIPYGIDVSAYRPSLRRRTDGPFTFLYVCDFSWRKGLDLLLEAFINEFEPGEARLVMRVHGRYVGQGVASDEVERVLYETVQGRLERQEGLRPEVTVMTEPLSPPALKRLYESADLYISTDRANGWGMPCQEAMALGIPAAAINWSGSTEFMREGNSVLIQPESELVPVDARLVRTLPHLYDGQRWPRVEAAEVRRVMRWAVQNPEALRAVAEAGARHVRQELDLDVVARRVADRFSTLNPRGVQLAASTARLYLPWIAATRTARRMLRAFRRT